MWQRPALIQYRARTPPHARINTHRSLPQIAAFDVGSIDEEDAGPKDACEAVYPHKVGAIEGGLGVCVVCVYTFSVMYVSTCL